MMVKAIRLGEGVLFLEGLGGRTCLIPPSAFPLINELSKEPQRERSTVNTHTQLSTQTGAQTGPSVFNFLGFWLQRLSDDLYSSGYYSWHPVDPCLMSALLKKKKKSNALILKYQSWALLQFFFEPAFQLVCKNGKTSLRTSESLPFSQSEDVKVLEAHSPNLCVQSNTWQVKRQVRLRDWQGGWRTASWTLELPPSHFTHSFLKCN